MKKRKKAYLEMEKKYRLEHPFYNWIYKYDPRLFGFMAGGLSGFIWVIVFPDYMRMHITICTISTGIIGWFLSKLSHKEFEKEKIRHGFRRDEWYLE